MKIPSNAVKVCTSLNCPDKRSICCNEPAIVNELNKNEFICRHCGEYFVGGKCTAGDFKKIKKYLDLLPDYIDQYYPKEKKDGNRGKATVAITLWMLWLEDKIK